MVLRGGLLRSGVPEVSVSKLPVQAAAKDGFIAELYAITRTKEARQPLSEFLRPPLF